MTSIAASSCTNDIDAKMSTSSLELRKANKPLMEKRRRARINKSLNELKTILMESTKRNTPGHSKWEKADILEMTVSYLHCLRNQQKATRTDPLAVGQFIAGFSECVRQIQKFGTTEITLERETQQKLNDHLLNCLKTFSDDATRGLQNSPTDSNSHSHSLRSSMTPPSPEPSPVGSLNSEDSNNSPTSNISSSNCVGSQFTTTFDPNLVHNSHCVSVSQNLIPINGKDVWQPWR